MESSHLHLLQIGYAALIHVKGTKTDNPS